MPAAFAAQFDPRDPYEVYDFDWIGEDGNGVWIARHPEAVLLENPELWDVVERFRAGQGEVTRDDWNELSSFEYDALLVMNAAASRRLDGTSRDRR